MGSVRFWPAWALGSAGLKQLSQAGSVLTQPRPTRPSIEAKRDGCGSRCLVVHQEGPWQRYGARAGQVGATHREAARGDAEHRGERGVRRDVREDLPRWRAILVDRAAGRGAEAAGERTR